MYPLADLSCAGWTLLVIQTLISMSEEVSYVGHCLILQPSFPFLLQKRKLRTSRTSAAVMGREAKPADAPITTQAGRSKDSNHLTQPQSQVRSLSLLQVVRQVYVEEMTTVDAYLGESIFWMTKTLPFSSARAAGHNGRPGSKGQSGERGGCLCHRDRRTYEEPATPTAHVLSRQRSCL